MEDHFDNYVEGEQSGMQISAEILTRNNDNSETAGHSPSENVLEKIGSGIFPESCITKNCFLPKRSKQTYIILDIDSDSGSEGTKLKATSVTVLEKSNFNKRRLKRDAIEDGKKPCSLSDILDSESEDEEQNTGLVTTQFDDKAKSKSLNKGKASNKNESKVQKEKIDLNKANTKVKMDKPLQQMSAKLAEEQMKAIKSTTQRLARETEIRIPYHKPKQYSLQEFMTRKTITKPNLKRTGSLKTCSLKMNQEELERYAQHLDERAREAVEFFKSEFEGEEHSEENSEKNMPSQEVGQIRSEVFNTQENHAEVTTSSNVDNTKASNIPLTPQISISEFKQSNNEISTSKEIASAVNTENSEDLYDVKCCKSTSNIKNIKVLLNDIDLPQNPSLKGDPNTVIDLETGDVIPSQSTGVDSLLQKFLKSSAKKRSTPNRDVSILCTENGTVESTNNKMSHNEDLPKNEMKPSSAYLKLKSHLKFIIEKKRKEQLMKKLYKHQLDTEEEEKCLAEEDNLFDTESEDDTKEFDDEENESDDNDDSYDDENELDTSNSSNTTDDDDVETVSDNNEDEEINTGNNKKNKVFVIEDSDDEEDREEINVESNSPLRTNKSKKDDEEDENELLQNCSGRVNSSLTQKKHFDDSATESQFVALCSGNFDVDVEGLVEDDYESENIVSSENNLVDLQKDSEEDICEKVEERVEFSDDVCENDTNNLQKNKESSEYDSSEDVSEIDESCPLNEKACIYINYDSEESEIEVKDSRDERFKQAADFFENEAELSEPEWESADEDEKDMDKYDIELGDEEYFDNEKLKRELGKIHLRKILDDNIREVKRIQQLLLEDEENDGLGRQRQYKWKNLESDFGLDNGNLKENINEDVEDSGDEESEAYCRKMRYERELVLKKKNAEDKVLSPLQCTEDVTTSTSKKITIIKPKNSINSLTSDAHFPLILSKAKGRSLKGSFLVRDEETLSKLATIVKGKFDSDASVLSNSGNSKNFVFTTIDEEGEMISLKRKSSPESSIKDCNISNDRKKQKLDLNKKGKTQLIDLIESP